MKYIMLATLLYAAVFTLPPPSEAPSGVDNLTADPATANQPQHIADEATFAEHDTIE